MLSNSLLSSACSDCSEPGQCQGTVVDVFIVEDICECKAGCQNSTTGCQFLSFDNSTGICTETSTCGTVDKNCKDCSWMPRTCGNEGSPTESQLLTQSL